MEYFLLTAKEERKGPFTLDQLKEEIKSRSELVWTKEYNDWKRVDEVPELEETVCSLPPDSPKIKPLRTWQRESVLVTIINGALASGLLLVFPFCGVATPLGIVGVINAVKAEKYMKLRKWEKAEDYALKAKKWTVWAAGIGLGGGILSVLCWLVFLLFSFVLVDLPQLDLPF